jgi:hypothetical protein
MDTQPESIFTIVEDAPEAPPRKSPGPQGDAALRAGLMGMRVGDCADVPRTVAQVVNCVYGIRKRYPDLPFRVTCRTTTPGHCRIWRTE